VKQGKLSDYPSEKAKTNPNVRVIRPPRKKGEEIIPYPLKHREVPEVAVVSPEESEEAKRRKLREIEYQKMKMNNP